MNITKIIDLSIPITNQTPIYTGDPRPIIKPTTSVEKDGYNVSSLHIGSHTGTHIDAPYHINDSKKKIDEIELERVMGIGRVIDASKKGPGEAIKLNEVRESVENFKRDEIALFYTGWDRYIGEEMYYNHPFVEREVIEKLLSRGVKTFFIDALNIDTPQGDNFDAHELITNENGIIGENFSNIGAIDFTNPLIIALPLKLTGVDGSPVRAIALKID